MAMGISCDNFTCMIFINVFAIYISWDVLGFFYIPICCNLFEGNKSVMQVLSQTFIF